MIFVVKTLQKVVTSLMLTRNILIIWGADMSESIPPIVNRNIYIQLYTCYIYIKEPKTSVVDQPILRVSIGKGCFPNAIAAFKKKEKDHKKQYED